MICTNKYRSDNEKYKALLRENSDIFSNRIKESKQEMELISKLLYEALPLIKTQLKLDEYNTMDINEIKENNNSVKKRETLQRILDCILAKKNESGLTSSKSSSNLQ